MVVRLLLAVGVVAGCLLAAWAHRAGRARDAADDRGLPPVPAEWLAGAERTWLVFTTRFCAACGPVAEQLRASDGGARVVTVDVEHAPELAGAYRVRSAPTVVLAGSGGEVRARLVGPASVRDYLRELVAD